MLAPLHKLRPPSSRRVTRDIRGDRLFEGEFKVGDYCFASQGEDRYDDVEDGEHVYLHPATIKSVTDSIVSKVQWWDGDTRMTDGPFSHIRKGLLQVGDIVEIEYASRFCGGVVKNTDYFGISSKLKDQHELVVDVNLFAQGDEVKDTLVESVFIGGSEGVRLVKKTNKSTRAKA